MIVEIPGVGRVEFPDTMTPEQIQTAADRLYKRAQAPAALAPAALAPAAPSGFLMGVRDPVDAAAQLLERSLPTSVVSGINQFNDWLVDMGVPLQRLGQEGLGGQLENLETAYQDRRQQEGDTGMDWDRLGGNILSPVNIFAASRLPQAASFAGRLGTAAAGGAGLGLLSQPVQEGEDFWTEKAGQAALGAAGGAAGSALFGGLGQLGRMARRPEVRQMQQAGVEPTVGQAVGGPLGQIEQKIASVPFVGDAVAGARRRAVEQFNKAALNRVLEPLGESSRAIGQKGIAEAQRKVSKAFEDASKITPGVTLRIKAWGDIDNLRTLLRGAPETVERDFERFYRQVFERRLGGARGMEIQNFQQLDSDLGKRIRGTKDQDLRNAFREFQSILRQQAADQSPKYAEAIGKARTAYARLVELEEAAKAAKAQEGVFSPGQLVAASKKGDISARQRATAAGQAPGQEFASAGQTVLGNTVPNSGTFDRAALAAMVGAGVDPTLGGAMGIGMLGSTPAAQRAMIRALQSTPNIFGTKSGALMALPSVEAYEAWR